MTAAEMHTVLDALDVAGCWLSARAVAARSLARVGMWPGVATAGGQDKL